MRDYLSGYFSKYTSEIKPSTSMRRSNVDPNSCTCNNILEEVKKINWNNYNNIIKLFKIINKAVYNFYVNSNFTAITNITATKII